jgi:hypothetical protein
VLNQQAAQLRVVINDDDARIGFDALVFHARKHKSAPAAPAHSVTRCRQFANKTA